MNFEDEKNIFENFQYCFWGYQTFTLTRGQTNKGYKNTNPDKDIHLLIFVSYTWKRILEKGIRIG